jgi:glucan phosphoethanolaminetransferase (alkaline phosphatase superfamily)
MITGKTMTKKKRFMKESLWFICGVAGGIILSLIFFDIINVDIDLAVVTAGVLVTLLAIYVVRITFWVFKQSV